MENIISIPMGEEKRERGKRKIWSEEIENLKKAKKDSI